MTKKPFFQKDFESKTIDLYFSQDIEVWFYESAKPQSYKFGIVHKKNLQKEENIFSHVVNFCYNDKIYTLGEFVNYELAKHFCEEISTEVLKQFLINFSQEG